MGWLCRNIELSSAGLRPQGAALCFLLVRVDACRYVAAQVSSAATYIRL